MTIAILSATSMLSAHALWVNVFPTKLYAYVSLGFGHSLPFQDVLMSKKGKVNLERFTLISPSSTETELKKPTVVMGDPIATLKGVEVFDADVAMQKVVFDTDESEKGTYQVVAVSESRFYTKYIDNEGKEKKERKPMTEMNDIKDIIMSLRTKIYGKAFFTLGDWTEPKPIGKGLEIVPKTDLSKLKVGDLVEVEVLFDGEPLKRNPKKDRDFISAYSTDFGQPDKFTMVSSIRDGKAKFRVQTIGQWLVEVKHKKDVTKDGPLKDLVGQVLQDSHRATITFHVK